MGTRYFTDATFRFLRELGENNNREWWEDHKERYRSTIREPALDFIADFGDLLAGISPHFSADTRVNGGSLMRPYRDIRFSKDKTPYKTNVGIQFRHRRGGDVHSPGFYLHLEPRTSFAGVGLWRPEAQVAGRIRQAIFEDPVEWGEVAHGAGFVSVWAIGEDDEDRLRRVPKELNGEHPYPDDLRLRSFVASSRLTQADVTSADFADDLAARFGAAAPFTRFLCGAVGVSF